MINIEITQTFLYVLQPTPLGKHLLENGLLGLIEDTNTWKETHINLRELFVKSNSNEIIVDSKFSYFENDFMKVVEVPTEAFVVSIDKFIVNVLQLIDFTIPENHRTVFLSLESELNNSLTKSSSIARLSLFDSNNIVAKIIEHVRSLQSPVTKNVNLFIKKET